MLDTDALAHRFARIEQTLALLLARLDTVEPAIVALQADVREVQASSGGVYPTRNPEVVAQEIATGMRG